MERQAHSRIVLLYSMFERHVSVSVRMLLLDKVQISAIGTSDCFLLNLGKVSTDTKLKILRIILSKVYSVQKVSNRGHFRETECIARDY